MSTIYLSHDVCDQLAAAQQAIDQHLVTCRVCTTDQPCYDRIEAERVFPRYGRLPRRTPA